MSPISVTMWDTLKLIPLVFVLAVLQTTSTPGLRPYGAGPDLLLVLVVALALWRSPVEAAVTGFLAGILVNAMVFTTLGVASLLYVATAALVARGAHIDDDGIGGPPVPGRQRRSTSLRLVPWAIAAALGTQIGDVLLHRLLLGVDLSLSYLWWNQVVPSVIQTGLVALILAPVLRWIFPPTPFVRDAGIATA